MNTQSSFTTSIFSFSLFVSTDSPTKAPCPRLTPARCLRGWIWTINRGLSLGCRHRRKWRCYLTSEIIHKVGLLLRLSRRLRPPAGGRRDQRQHALQQRHLETVLYLFIDIYFQYIPGHRYYRVVPLYCCSANNTMTIGSLIIHLHPASSRPLPTADPHVFSNSLSTDTSLHCIWWGGGDSVVNTDFTNKTKRNTSDTVESLFFLSLLFINYLSWPRFFKTQSIVASSHVFYLWEEIVRYQADTL